MTRGVLALAAILATGCSSGAATPTPTVPDPSTFRVGFEEPMRKPCDWSTEYQFAELVPQAVDVIDPGPDETESPGSWNPQVIVTSIIQWRNVPTPTDITITQHLRYDDPGVGVEMFPTYGGICDNVPGRAVLVWYGYWKEQRSNGGRVAYRLTPTPVTSYKPPQ